jgi:hypothetical protein
MGLNDGVGAFDQVLEFTLFFVHHHGPGKCGLRGAALLERIHREDQGGDAQQDDARQGDEDDFFTDIHWRPPSVPVQ